MVRFLCICVVVFVPMRAAAEPVVVFAAASLRVALEDIFAEYDGDVVVSYGGSGAMAQQILRGAPADIYLSANVTWVNWLGDEGIEGERVDLLSNRLVVVINKDFYAQALGPDFDFAETAAIAIGQTDSVPVGIYARQSLEATGDWTELRDRVIEFPSASAVLRAIELGEVPAGVIYYTDAVQSDRVGVVQVLARDSHDPIRYPFLLLNPEARPVFAHLQSALAMEIFRGHGFRVLDAP